MPSLVAPPSASTVAADVDSLVLLMVGLSVLIAFGIFASIVVFCVKYRRRPGNEIGHPTRHTTPIELTWTLVPLALSMIPFVWGARIYFAESQPPADALEVYVVAREWMWKTELPGGQSEIDALHVPTGRAIKLTMTSQYCGTDHAQMIGQVIAMAPGDYANWLTHGITATGSPADQGRKLFLQYGCASCHEAGRAPNLQGVFGQSVQLSD